MSKTLETDLSLFTPLLYRAYYLHPRFSYKVNYHKQIKAAFVLTKLRNAMTQW